MFEEYLSSSSSKINYLANTKRAFNVSTIVSDFDQKLNPLPYKFEQYKNFIEKTEQSMILIEKSITRLTDHFKEHKRLFEFESHPNGLHDVFTGFSNGEVLIEEKSNIGSIFEKFNNLNKSLSNNTINYLKNLSDSTLSPLEQINVQQNNENERENLKKNLNKALRFYESKKLKHKKSLKDLVYSNTNDSIFSNGLGKYSDSRDEKSNISAHLFEYLSQINKVKTEKLNQVVTCLVASFKNQLKYVEESYKILYQFIESNDDTSHTIEAFLSNFNSRQTIEKQMIDRKLKSLRAKAIYRTESSPFINLNHSTVNSTNNSNSSSSSNSKPSFFLKHKTTPPLFGMTHPFSSNIQIFDSQNIYSNIDLNNNNINTSKSGYLLKKSMHTRFWLKRKCSAENGIFNIHHSDEFKEPTKLNLALCEIKPFGDKKFQVYYPNEKVFNFMTEKETELTEWLTVLNHAKKNFYLNNNEKTNDHYVESIITKVTKLKGNLKCCDCDADNAEWLSTNLGVLTCIYCCGIHRDLGVHISKTQSIKIDRLTSFQLIVASLIGNQAFNKVFEANLDPYEKIRPDCSTEMRHKFIRDKYEKHKFVRVETNLEKVMNEFIDYVKVNDYKKNFEMLLYIYGQNLNLMTPFENSLNRNILQLCIIHLDEEIFFYLSAFIIQNRDFNKNKFTIDHRDINGNSALHFCAIYNRIETAKCLLKANANIETLNDNNLTPYELANQYSNYDLANQIKLHKEGKPIDKIAWILTPPDNQELHERLSDKTNISNLNDENSRNIFPAKRVIRARPVTMIDVNDQFSPLSALKNHKNKFRPKSHIRNSSLNSSKDPFFHELSNKIQQFNSSSNESDGNEISTENETQNENKALLKCKSIKDYQSANPTHLSFRYNDMIIIEAKYDENIWYGYVEDKPNKKGIFLSNLVNMYI